MNNRKGFSIPEMLVSALVITVVFAALGMIMSAADKIYFGLTDSVEIRQHARNVMDRVVREVRESNASTVTVQNAAGDRITFTSPRFKDAGGNLQPIGYYLSEGKVFREYPTGTAKPIAVDVVLLKFVKTSPQLLITVQTEKTVLGRLYSFVLTQKVRLRNE